MIPCSGVGSGSDSGSREILEGSRDPKSAIYVAKPPAIAASSSEGGVKPKVVEARSYSPFKGGKASPPSSQSTPAPPAVTASAVTKTAAPVVAAAPAIVPVATPFYLQPKEVVKNGGKKQYVWSPHSVTLRV